MCEMRLLLDGTKILGMSEGDWTETDRELCAKRFLRTPMFTANGLEPEMSRESRWGQTSILYLSLVHG